MTLSVPDLLHNQIAQCWRPPPIQQRGIVAFELYLDEAGSVARPPRFIEPVGQMAATAAAVESVRRAIYTCASYRLPVDRYQQWRQVTIKFDMSQTRGESGD